MRKGSFCDQSNMKNQGYWRTDRLGEYLEKTQNGDKRTEES